MVAVDKEIKSRGWQDRARLILQVHDELVYYIDRKDMKQTIKVISDILTDRDIGTGIPFSIPLDIDIEVGEDWGHLKDYRLEVKTDDKKNTDS